MVLTSIACSYFIEKTGRKKLNVIGFFVCWLTMGFLAFASFIQLDPIYAVILVSLYIMSYGVSVGGLGKILMADFLTDSGMSIANTFFWLWIILTAEGFPYIKENFSITVCFTIFSIVSGVSIFFNLFVLIETKGKT